MNKFSLMLAMMALMFSACVDEPIVVPDEDALPEITFEGKNVLACRVNGRLFNSKTKASFGGTVKPSFAIGARGFVLIEGSDYENAPQSGIVMASNYKDGQKEFNLDYYWPPFETTFYEWAGASEVLYRKIDSEPHHLKLLHLDDKIAVGTFAFTAVSENGDTVRITDGRFDIARD